MNTDLSDIKQYLSDQKQNYVRLEPEHSVTRQVNNKLKENMVSLQPQSWSSSQYSRRENLELSDTPDETDQKDLKDTALNIFRKLGVENDSSKYWGLSLVTEQGTQTCNHQIFKTKRCKQNSSLQDLTSLGISFPVFISDSLCQYYKILWWKCKKLLTNKIIDL